MDGKQTSYCIVVDKKSQNKFICYTRRKNGMFDISLTDAVNVWSSDFTSDTLEQFINKFSLKSTDDFFPKIRSGCSRGDVSVVVHDSTADLCMGSGLADLRVTLNSLEGTQAKDELKELLFKMADNLIQTDSECVSPSISPVKNIQRKHTGFEPRQQNGASSGILKKRVPGASLINPGAKKKMKATGVAFDDADED
ncbi:protein PAXX isoform X1 [Xyrichtys novacula]|uniref:Protein PAXX isoform X1 n=1 Tax=Xyrichtys novacula TaxID=13765 RepID=A0AAV1G7Z9_XYRNO|nr:protein PAXX isoform X1 [Xyrichtys novacula]